MPYYEGGLTLDQALFLIEELIWENNPRNERSKPEPEDNYLFKDPEEYKDMTEEEKRSETEKMKNKLKFTGLPGIR